MSVTKYHNRRTTIDGITFDSQAEARRYEQLRLLQQAGDISELNVHERIVIVPAECIDGKLEHALHYEADFIYVSSDGWRVVEDVKGAQTPLFRLKWRLVRQRWAGLKVRFRVIPAGEV
jgi:hypothetical protein